MPVQSGLPIPRSWARPSPRICCRGRSSETTIFVNKGPLKQCAKAAKLNTPSQAYRSLQAEGSDGRRWHQRCQTFRFAGESQCTTAFMERVKRKARSGSYMVMSEWETLVRPRIQLCHFTPHEAFFSRAPPSLFFNSSRFPLLSSAPFSHCSPPGLPSLWWQPAETSPRLGCRRSRVTECSRGGGFSHARCAAADGEPARQSLVPGSEGQLKAHLQSAGLQE